MNVFKLSWKNLINKPLSLVLSTTLFALGVGLISLLLLLNKQLEEKFDKNLAGIDLVLGAKGSPLQLILCNMYHIDAPTGNIDISEARAFLRPDHPLISDAVPLSLGDNYRNFRIVGTTPDFLDLYEAKIEKGQLFKMHFDVVVGANVARSLNLEIGDTFFSAHGFDHEEELEHESDHPFKVTGILEPTGAVIDQLIVTTTPTIWMVHEHGVQDDATMHEGEEDHDQGAEDHDHEGHDHGDGDHDHDHEGHDHEDGDHDHDHEGHDHNALANMYQAPLESYVDKQITSILIRFSARNFRTLSMQRNINENTNLQAATPAIEINRLFSLMGVGLDTLRVLAWVIVFVSGLSIFISLLNSLRDRQYELALMRVMGATRMKLGVLIIIEGLMIAVLGYIFGILISHLAVEYLSDYMQEAYRYSLTGKIWLQAETWLLGGCLLVGLISAIIPAILAIRTDISETLART